MSAQSSFFWNTKLDDIRLAQVDQLIAQLKVYLDRPIEDELKPVKPNAILDIANVLEQARELNLFVEKQDKLDGIDRANHAFLQLNEVCEAEGLMSEQISPAMKVYAQAIGDLLEAQSNQLTDATVPQKHRAKLFGELIASMLLQKLNMEVNQKNTFLVVRVINVLDLRRGLWALTMDSVQDPNLKIELRNFWSSNDYFVGDSGDGDRWVPEGLPDFRPLSDVEYLTELARTLKARIEATKLINDPSLSVGPQLQKRMKWVGKVLVGFWALVVIPWTLAVIADGMTPGDAIGGMTVIGAFIGWGLWALFNRIVRYDYIAAQKSGKCKNCGSLYRIVTVKSLFLKNDVRTRLVATQEKVKDMDGRPIGYVEGSKQVNEKVSVHREKRCCLSCGHVFKEFVRK